jgi:hypothetical protein
VQLVLPVSQVLTISCNFIDSESIYYLKIQYYRITDMKEKHAKDCYEPYPGLILDLQEILRANIEEREMKAKILAAKDKHLTEGQLEKILTEGEKRHIDPEQKHKLEQSLNTKKTRLLNNYVFPSMANLVVFFRYAATLELREKFDKDIQELLLGYKPEAGGNILYRLINHMLTLPNLNFVISEILQQEIWTMFLANKPKYKDELFVNVTMPDIGRALAWTHSLSEQGGGVIKFNYRRSKRPVLF